MGMMQRCYSPNHIAYLRYGGRGIYVVERWHYFPNFVSDIGKRPEGCTLDRNNNDGPYGPDNWHWATATEQANNTSTNRCYEFNGETKSVSELATKYGLKISTVFQRLKRGWSIDKALTIPTETRFSRHAAS